MFKIGAFSKLAQISIRMLRYYDEVGLLKPAEADKSTGHRLYSVEQIPRLNKIIYLRDSGFNISEITLALEMNTGALLETLDKKQLEIEQIIQIQQEKLRKIAIAKNEIQENKGELHYNISIKSIPAYPVLSLRRIVPSYYSEGDLWHELSAFAKEQRIELTGHTFSIYHDQSYREKDVDIELCASIREKKSTHLEPFHFRMTDPVHTMACTMVYGDFSNIAGAYIAFAEWLQKNSDYKMTGPTRQIVHRGPWNEDNPNKYLIEIQIPMAIQ